MRHLFPFVSRLAVLLSACCLSTGAQAVSCASFPTSWVVRAGGQLKIENSVTVNGITVNKSETSGAWGVNGNTGAIQNATATMPSLDPPTYPSFSGGSSLTTPATVAPGTYTTVSVAATASDPDTTFSGGATYYINTLNVAASATVQFAPGNYFIRSMTMGNGARLTVAAGGPVRIYTNSSFTWGTGLHINDGGNAANLQIYMYPSATSGSLGTGSSFTGLIYAPQSNQNLTIGGLSTVTGAFFAGGTLEVKDNTTMVFDTTVQGQISGASTCSAVMVARYRFDEAAWSATAGAVQDSSGNNRHATAMGSTLPSTANTTPARSGNPGTCGYGVFPGPDNGGGAVRVNGLPVDTVAGLRNSVSLWLYYTAGSSGIVLGWYSYDLFLSGGVLGFNSFGGDWLYTTLGGMDRWVHVVAIFANGNQSLSELYIDGVKRTLAMSGTARNGNAYAASTLTIGGAGISTNFRLVGANVDEVQVFSGTLSEAMIATLYNETHPCAVTGPHHLEISDSSNGNGLTCAPSTLTIRACADAACSSLYTGGISGTLTATTVNGSPTANWGGGSADFTIAAGSSSVTKTLQLTSNNTDVTVALGATSSASNATTCTFSGCQYTASNSGFLFNVPDHVAATTQTVTIGAVRMDNTTNACVPAFANVSKTVKMTCGYSDPGTGFWPVVVNGTALNLSGNSLAACNSDIPVTLSFDGNGRASMNVSYADAGRMSLQVAYTGSAATGDDGLTMSTTDSFIAVPKDILISGVPTDPPEALTAALTAGIPFNATVTVRNQAGTAMPNFGRETAAATVTVVSANAVPGSGNAADISATFSGFSGGQSSRNLVWSEVGQIDLQASLTNYLSSTLNAAGALTGVGRFKPAYFKTDVTQGCVAGSYTYSGQPFPVRTTAYAAGGTVTANYAGATWAKATTLSAVPSTTGSLSNSAIGAADFTAGVANQNATFTFSAAQTVPQTIAIRATDTDGVTSNGVVDGEGIAALRSGRLVLRSNYGSELLPLILAAETQFWQEGGNVGSTADDYWTVNIADTCSTLVAANVSLDNFRPGSDPGLKAGETSVIGVSGISAGRGSVTLAAPGATNSGSVNVTLKTTTMGLPWLSEPPPARATFGLRRTSVIHLRENF